MGTTPNTWKTIGCIPWTHWSHEQHRTVNQTLAYQTRTENNST
jgi:hypothetical protein